MRRDCEGVAAKCTSKLIPKLVQCVPWLTSACRTLRGNAKLDQPLLKQMRQHALSFAMFVRCFNLEESLPELICKPRLAVTHIFKEPNDVRMCKRGNPYFSPKLPNELH